MNTNTNPKTIATILGVHLAIDRSTTAMDITHRHTEDLHLRMALHLHLRMAHGLRCIALHQATAPHRATALHLPCMVDLQSTVLPQPMDLHQCTVASLLLCVEACQDPPCPYP